MIYLYIIVLIVIIEVFFYLLIKSLRRRFQWLITPADEYPALDKDGLEKFFDHGYDPELGWVRKPNTSHNERGKSRMTSYHIDGFGARCHPGLDYLQPLIGCYGDSFTFCRQVDDNETWPYQLSKLSSAGVINFGVGNYGADQAYLRMLRQIQKHKTQIVIMGVVPSTIVRVLCVWKHYNEFGNTFGFKPRFDIKEGVLTLTKNIMDSEPKFYSYKDHIDEIRKNDFFYKSKFKKEMLRFPYSLTIFRNFSRNFSIIGGLILSSLLKAVGVKNEAIDEYPMNTIMKVNLRLRQDLYKNRYAVNVFKGIVKEFAAAARRSGAKPAFVFLPQKDDILCIKEHGPYYSDFIRRISKDLPVIDLTESLLKADNLDDLYSDNNDYGGHPSALGNRFIAEVILDGLAKSGILTRQTSMGKA